MQPDLKTCSTTYIYILLSIINDINYVQDKWCSFVPFFFATVIVRILFSFVLNTRIFFLSLSPSPSPSPSLSLISHLHLYLYLLSSLSLCPSRPSLTHSPTHCTLASVLTIPWKLLSLKSLFQVLLLCNKVQITPKCSGIKQPFYYACAF